MSTSTPISGDAVGVATAFERIRTALRLAGQEGRALKDLDLSHPALAEVAGDMQRLQENFEILKRVTRGGNAAALRSTGADDWLSWYAGLEQTIPDGSERLRHVGAIGRHLLQGSRFAPPSDSGAPDGGQAYTMPLEGVPATAVAGPAAEDAAGGSPSSKAPVHAPLGDGSPSADGSVNRIQDPAPPGIGSSPVGGMASAVTNALQSQWIENLRVGKAAPFFLPVKSPDADAEDDLGELSSRHEAKRNSKKIGWDKRGGTSYGKYQIASLPGTMGKFMDWVAKKPGTGAEVARRLRAAGNANTGETTGAMPTVWQELVDEGKMGNFEDEFIKTKIYDVAFRKLDQTLRERVGSSNALQQVLWSTAVQHGPNLRKESDKHTEGGPTIWNNSFQAGDDDAALIRKVYERRRYNFRNSPDRNGVWARFDREMPDALKMLSDETGRKQAQALARTKAEVLMTPSPYAAGLSGPVGGPGVLDAATEPFCTPLRPYGGEPRAAGAAGTGTPQSVLRVNAARPKAPVSEDVEMMTHLLTAKPNSPKTMNPPRPKTPADGGKRKAPRVGKQKASVTEAPLLTRPKGGQPPSIPPTGRPAGGTPLPEGGQNAPAPQNTSVSFQIAPLRVVHEAPDGTVQSVEHLPVTPVGPAQPWGMP